MLVMNISTRQSTESLLVRLFDRALTRIKVLLIVTILTGCGDQSDILPQPCTTAQPLLRQTHSKECSAAETSSVFQADAVTAVKAAPQTRRFRFNYAFTFSGLEEGKRVRIWMPVPPTNSFQQVQRLQAQLPIEASLHADPDYGNQILYLQTRVPESGQLAIDVPYRVQRTEVIAGHDRSSVGAAKALSEDDQRLFLRSNALVPITGKPLELLRQIDLSLDPLKLARQLYDVVDRHVTYKKDGADWGKGNVLWVCDSRFGNCTDFHSLFISLARSQRLPAKFEIGFPIPADAPEGVVAGYHCWAWFFRNGRGWIPVDISEADKYPHLKDYYFGNLSADRVLFSVGRDIHLLPPQSGPPLNFFVYPYAEIEGKPVTQKQLKVRFTYKDMAES